MLQQYLWRGLKAGLVAGLVFGLFVAGVVNPVVGMAEEVAGEHDHAEEHAGEHGGESEGLLSEVTAKGVSVLGGVFWALLLGVVTFGLAFYFLEPAIPGAGDTQSYLLGAAGFVTVSGAPWLVLPPQPPGVEQALATNVRMGLYGGMMVAGLLTCGLAGYTYIRLRERGQPLAVAGAIVPFCLLVFLSALAPANSVTVTLSEPLAVAFRGLVVASQAIVWLVLASVHSWLLDRDRPASTTDPTTTSYPESATAD